MAATTISLDRDKVYLGDGLYAEYDGWQIKLYASNGVEATDTVYLEPSVLAAFERYVERLRSAADSARDGGEA